MKSKLTWVIITALLLQSGAFMYFIITKPKVGYVEIGKVYNEFKLKKELDKQLENVVNKRKLATDSLELELTMLSSKLQSIGEKAKEFPELAKTFEYKRQNYLMRKQSFAKDNEALTLQYEEQIFTQVNQYMKEYGSQMGYAYIFGADGSGNLMYAEDASNITGEVSKYIDQKYLGK